MSENQINIRKNSMIEPRESESNPEFHSGSECHGIVAIDSVAVDSVVVGNPEFHGSPGYVRTSLAAAISLGMERGRFARGAGCGCLNILLHYENGCAAHCGYCGLAADRKHEGLPSFIRVRWPVYSMESILDKLRQRRHPFKRVCVSMVTRRRAVDDCAAIVRAFASDTDLPVSVLLTPTIMDGEADLRRIKNAGADRVGIAIDAATEPLFDATRGKGVKGPHRWERYIQAVDEAVSVFGRYNAGVHLIVGLGETEEEMTRIIDACYKKGALTHLFSFYPEPGSLMENHPRPSIESYRRIQLARYLINEGIRDYSGFTFSGSGELTDFGIDIDPYIKCGLPFMTSGCPGKDGLMACNRPYSNERPSEPIRNYHFIPDEDDIDIIASQYHRAEAGGRGLLAYDVE